MTAVLMALRKVDVTVLVKALLLVLMTAYSMDFQMVCLKVLQLVLMKAGVRASEMVLMSVNVSDLQLVHLKELTLKRYI